jgi:tetratricopeptide (TPR) repeat protein
VQVETRRPNTDWHRATSGNITAVGKVSETKLRRAVARIAGFQAAMEALYPNLRRSDDLPVRVVLRPGDGRLGRFAPRDERGRPQENVGGYFLARPDVNLIVVAGDDDSTIFHEFTHFYLSSHFHSLPRWLSEGLAEFHSTFDADWTNGKSLIGRAPKWRVASLREGRFVRLRDILLASAEDMARMGRDPERAVMFYAESWALVHYLTVGRPNTPGGTFGRFVQAMERGTKIEPALQEFFATTIDELDQDLRQYVKRPAYPAWAFTMPRDSELRMVVEPMHDVEVNFVEGDLLADVGSLEEAEAELKAALARDAAYEPARIALGRVRLGQEGRSSEGVALLREVLAANPSSFAAAYALASALADGNEHVEALALFDRATRMNSRSSHAWLGLSMSALALGRTAQSNATLSLAMQLNQSPRHYATRARRALGFGMDAVAVADARRYIAVAGWNIDTVYTAIIGALAHLRLGDAAEAAAVLERARFARLPAWTVHVLDFLQDRVPAEALLAKAKTTGEKTEAHAYIGFKAALAGRYEEAVTRFTWVVENGAPTYTEFEMARAELHRLRLPPPQSGSDSTAGPVPKLR